MPSAWEGTNLAHNLQVFQALRAAARGSKVSFDSGSGRFSVQEPGVLQTVARTFSRDSVESDEYFAAPVTGLFREARRQIGTGVTQQAFDDAFAGLRALRASYTSADAAQRRKLVAIDAVLNSASGGEDPGFAGFRQRYRRHLVYGVSMNALLHEGRKGICAAMAIDWARRILAGKESYAVSKKRPGQPYDANPASLSGAEQARMLRKVNARLDAFQAALDQKGSVDYRDVRSVVRDAGKKFDELSVGKVDKYDAERAIGEAETGGNILWAVVNHCPTDRVSVVLLKGLVQNLRADGHAVGVHRTSARLAFFDPNVGEFSFVAPPAGKDEFLPFANELWDALYRPNGRQTFRAWEVITIGN